MKREQKEIIPQHTALKQSPSLSHIQFKEKKNSISTTKKTKNNYLCLDKAEWPFKSRHVAKIISHAKIKPEKGKEAQLAIIFSGSVTKMFSLSLSCTYKRGCAKSISNLIMLIPKRQLFLAPSIYTLIGLCQVKFYCT